MSDPTRFRRVLGHIPTGVVVVTGLDAERGPVGMTVGSFTSVSLDPPLVAFLPSRTSSTWARMRAAGSFVVNVLGAHQRHISHAFAAADGDRFDSVAWSRAGSGAPLIDGAVAWIDCNVEAVHEAGDHYWVLGRVRELEVVSTAPPLVFYRGAYESLAV
jgi:flavin reductase (DIM6/NTAB) family NADH-FMN oxidoreductase RutF